MSIAVIGTVPASEMEFFTWSFTHAAHHRDIISGIYRLSGMNLQEYALDPFNPEDLDTWLEHHQAMHADMDMAAGIAGYDLSELDWQNKEMLNLWINVNADEHRRIGQLLGLG